MNITSAADAAKLISAAAAGFYPKLAKLQIQLAASEPSNISPVLSNLPSLQQLHLHGQLSVSASLPSSLTSLSLSGPAAASAVSSISNCLQLQQLAFQEAVLPVGFSSAQLWSTLTPLTALTALDGTLAIPSCPSPADPISSDVALNPGQPWGAIGSEAPSSLPVVQRLKRLGLEQTSHYVLNKQQVSGFMVARGDISMLTKLEFLCLDLTTAARATAQPIVRLPANLLELHTTSPSTGSVVWSDLSFLKQVSIEVTLTEVRPMVSMQGIPSTLERVDIIGNTSREMKFQIQGMGVMPSLQNFTWWGDIWGLLSFQRGLMRNLAPSLRKVELFISDWPGAGLRGQVTAAVVAQVGPSMLSSWEHGPEVFRMAGIVDANTLEVGPFFEGSVV